MGTRATAPTAAALHPVEGRLLGLDVAAGASSAHAGQAAASEEAQELRSAP
jgi:hypothetical protein